MQSLSERYIKAKRRLFEKALTNLNDRQRDAVFATEGPLLVIAGAGSGKTTVLVKRIVYIMKYGNAYFSDYIPEFVDYDILSNIKCDKIYIHHGSSDAKDNLKFRAEEEFLFSDISKKLHIIDKKNNQIII